MVTILILLIANIIVLGLMVMEMIMCFERGDNHAERDWQWKSEPTKGVAGSHSVGQIRQGQGLMQRSQLTSTPASLKAHNLNERGIDG
jgi:hypothetical protein